MDNFVKTSTMNRKVSASISVSKHWCMQGGAPTLLGSKFFLIHALLGKIGFNKILAFPLRVPAPVWEILDPPLVIKNKQCYYWCPKTPLHLLLDILPNLMLFLSHVGKPPIPIKRLILLENVVAISLLCPSTGKKWKSQGKGVDVYSFYTNMHYFYIAPIDRAAVTSWLLLPTQHNSLSISVLFCPVFAIA